MKLVISPEVEGALNRKIRRKLNSGGSCLVCGQPLRSEDEAMVVVIEPAKRERRVGVAHPACHASEVVYEVHPSAASGLSWAPAIYPGSPGRPPRAVLVILHHRRLVSIDASGEEQDQLVDLLRGMGFQLVKNPAKLPETKVPGWKCQLTPEGKARVTSAEGVEELETENSLSEEWLEAARSEGWITLIEVTGAPVGVAAEQEVTAAAADKRLFAGRIEVVT